MAQLSVADLLQRNAFRLDPTAAPVAAQVKAEREALGNGGKAGKGQGQDGGQGGTTSDKPGKNRCTGNEARESNEDRWHQRVRQLGKDESKEDGTDKREEGIGSSKGGTSSGGKGKGGIGYSTGGIGSSKGGRQRGRQKRQSL